jgi:hypothetical protein
MQNATVKSVILSNLNTAISTIFDDIFESDPSKISAEEEYRKQTMIERLKFISELVNTFQLESLIDNEIRSEIWSKAHDWTEDNLNEIKNLA